jgi:hypothetical protein
MLSFFQVAIMGVVTKKLLYLGVRNLSCSICNQSKQVVREHLCYKTNPQLVKDSEIDLTLIGFKESVETHGVIYSHVVADNDSTLLPALNQFCDYSVTKSDCVIHVMRHYKSNIFTVSGL